MNTGSSISISELRTLQRKGEVRGLGAAKRGSPEEDLHRTCFEWIELHTPAYPVLRYAIHVPNGGKRPRGEAGKLKAMGVRKGVPDFLLPIRNGAHTGLATDGYLTGVARSLDQFASLMRQYLRGW